MIHTTDARRLSAILVTLIAVDDPISSHPDIVQDGHGRGMSQKGASRWARGNLSYNINQDLGAWSVRWERAEQILVHYYSGKKGYGASLRINIAREEIKARRMGCFDRKYRGGRLLV